MILIGAVNGTIQRVQSSLFLKPLKRLNTSTSPTRARSKLMHYASLMNAPATELFAHTEVACNLRESACYLREKTAISQTSRLNVGLDPIETTSP